MSLRDLVLTAAIHLALAAYALWAAGGRTHWLGRRSLHTLGAIFTLQALTPFSRGKWLVENSYERGPIAGLEVACGAGIAGGAFADRRWLLGGTLTAANALILLGRHPRLRGAQGVGRVLFFGSWLCFRSGATLRSPRVETTGSETDNV
jgi:hypothetical protein